MKTPRQFLLERHETAQVRLDAIRVAAVAGLKPRTPWWRVAWHELFWSARAAWSGVAALGLLALAFDFASRTSDTPARPPMLADRNLVEGLRERTELLAELATWTSPATVPPVAPSLPNEIPGRRRSSLDRVEWAA